MIQDYNKSTRRKKTRLTKLEEKRNIQQALFFITLSVILVIAFLIFGLPAVIKLAVWIGEKKSSSAPAEKSDTLAPNAPAFEYVNEATKSAALSLKGYAEPKSRVEIILNGQKTKEVLANIEGEFSVKGLTLTNGVNKIKAKATDEQDNQSDFSQTLTIVYDNIVPLLEIASPADGDKFFDKDREIDISGKTEEGSTVYINGRLAPVSADGEFALHYELTEGSNRLQFESTDLAGNQAKKEITVSYSP